MKKLLAVLLAGVMCMSMLTACGEKAPAESSAAVSSEVASEVASDAVETEVTKLVVGTNPEFPPFEYIGDDGQPAGFEIDLINAVAEKLGVEIEILSLEFGALVAAVGTKIDLSISGMTITDERKEAVDFSEPYFEAVQYVLVPAGSDIDTYDELKGKVIGSQLGTTGTIVSEEIEGVEAKTYNKGVEAVNDLIAGRIDAVIIDKDPAIVFAAENEGKVVALDGKDFGFEAELYGIALPKGSELTEKINAALEELKADGTYDALVKEYFMN